MVGCIDDKHISTIIAPSENETNYCMEWKDARWRGRGGSRVSGYPGLSPETSIPVRIHFK